MYTTDNHFSKLIQLKDYKRGLNDELKRLSFIVTGNMRNEPVMIKEDYWIGSAEKDKLEREKVNVDDIKIIWYVAGSCTPFSNHNSIGATSIDGYEVHLLY